MIVLPTTHKLQAVLSGAVATTQPHFWADYMDTTGDTVGSNNGTLNGVTDVDIVAAPAGNQRLVRQIHIFNADTAAVTVTVKTDAGGTERNLIKMTLNSGEALVYNSASGWNVQSISYNGSYQPLDGDLTALAALATTGVMARTAANTYTMRTVTGTTGKVTVTNGDGVSGNPTITIADALDLGGNTSVEIPNGAGGTTVDAAGEVCVDTTSKTLNFYDGAAEKVLTPVMSKSITIESPGASEDLSLFFTDDAITITKIVAVLTGSSTPSVTWTVRHHTNRSNAGNEVVTGGTTTTSTTTGSVVTSFNDATVPADSFLWLKTTAQSGTVTTINVTIFYTQDA